MHRAVIASGIVFTLSAGLASGDAGDSRYLGTTYIVRPDSTGDFVTIQAAVDAASDGDTVLVDPGEYGERLSVPFKDLVIRSSGGPDTTSTTSITLGVRGLVLEGFAIDSTILGTGDEEGVTLRNLVVDGEVNLEVQGPQSPGPFRWDPEALPPLEALRLLGNGLDAVGCTFRSDVTLTTFGEAVLAVEGCHIIDGTLDADAMFWACFVDSCTVTGDALLAEGDAGAWIRDSQATNGNLQVSSTGPFAALAWDNVVDLGMILVMGAEDADARNNNVDGNLTVFGGDLSSATASGNVVSQTLVVEGRQVSVRDNTVTTLDARGEMTSDVIDNLVVGGTLQVDADPPGGSITVTGNTVVGAPDAGILIDADLDDVTVTVTRNLVVECGVGIFLPAGADTAAVVASCNDVWASTGPNWLGLSDPTGTSGNISADPLFCDASNGDYRVSSNSPCLYGTCWQIGARGQGCVGDLPRIADITDVPNDQGGQVRLRWIRSGYDAAGDSIDVTAYGVYRRHEGWPVGPARTAPLAVGRDHTVVIDGWDFVATVPARGDSVYQFVAPTLCDSTIAEGMCWSVFFVSAMTPDPLTFFDSVPDSGYSIDNLAPSAPGDFIWTAQADSIHLTWSPVPDLDFDYYTVYGSETPDIGEASVIDYTVEPTLVLPMNEFLLPYYFVSATDFAGNEGAATGLDQPVGMAVATVVPAVYRLGAITPNPVGRRATVRFDLPEAGEVAIQVFDLQGRLVSTLASGHRQAGRHEVAWVTDEGRGRSLAAGVYFVRLDAPPYRQTRRVVLMR